VLNGLNGYDIDVEADLSSGLQAFNIVGLPDLSIKESKERVKSAISNSGFSIPPGRVTINLAPANLKKDGSQIDLAIAVSMLLAIGVIEYLPDDKTVFSDFSFSNTLKNADVKSFEALGQYYGKDKNNVYLMGEKIKKADVKTFQVISEEFFKHYSKDKNNVYLETYIIEGADPKTFEIIKEEPSYSKDKKYLYYSGKKIDEIRDNLENMSAGVLDIIKNGNKIYANGNRLDIENPENFKIIKGSYS